jgi:hypothetical protein
VTLGTNSRDVWKHPSDTSKIWEASLTDFRYFLKPEMGSTSPYRYTTEGNDDKFLTAWQKRPADSYMISKSENKNLKF